MNHVHPLMGLFLLLFKLTSFLEIWRTLRPWWAIRNIVIQVCIEFLSWAWPSHKSDWRTKKIGLWLFQEFSFWMPAFLRRLYSLYSLYCQTLLKRAWVLSTMGVLAYCKILSAWLHSVNIKDQRHSKHRYKSSFKWLIVCSLSMYEFEELSGFIN